MSVCLDLPNAIQIGQWLFNWQTLISGILALVAALWAGCNINKQNAARATLPLTLSGLAQVVEKLLLDLSQERLVLPEDGIVRKFKPPPVPMDAIPELQQIILSTDNPSVIKPIREIIIQMQTLWTRFAVSPHPDPHINDTGGPKPINDWIIQAAKVYALIVSLFDYARGRSQNGPESVAWGQVDTILTKLKIHDQKLEEIVKQRRKVSPDFWTLS
jgi:hypothetical protein